MSDSAAAGTGGHINPGITIANKEPKSNGSSEIIFIGADGDWKKWI